jgi:hypothetical protein
MLCLSKVSVREFHTRALQQVPPKRGSDGSNKVIDNIVLVAIVSNIGRLRRECKSYDVVANDSIGSYDYLNNRESFETIFR